MVVSSENYLHEQLNSLFIQLMKIEKFLNSSPIFHAYLLSEKLFTPFQAILKKEGLTFIQSMILASLYFEEESVTPTVISDSLNTSPSNVSHAVKYLKTNNPLNTLPSSS